GIVGPRRRLTPPAAGESLVAMSGPDRNGTVPLRREPPAFRRVAVRGVERRSPRLLRVTLAGADLAGLTVDHPAASVRWLIPAPGAEDLVIPSWNGNEFLLTGGRRPTIRTLTPRRVDTESLELDVEVV